MYPFPQGKSSIALSRSPRSVAAQIVRRNSLVATERLNVQGMMPVFVICALDFNFRNFFNMGIMFFGKRASAAQIGINRSMLDVGIGMTRDRIQQK
jgi:hypothetical protein